MTGPDGSRRVAVAASSLGVGDVTEATVGGVDLVVWRSHGGTPCVFEARCPHNWSHLGGLGAVDGEELVCLSHFWRFDIDGRGTKLNLHGRRDAKSDIAVYPCHDDGESIWVTMPPDPAD